MHIRRFDWFSRRILSRFRRWKSVKTFCQELASSCAPRLQSRTGTALIWLSSNTWRKSNSFYLRKLGTPPTLCLESWTVQSAKNGARGLGRNQPPKFCCLYRWLSASTGLPPEMKESTKGIGLNSFPYSLKTRHISNRWYWRGFHSTAETQRQAESRKIVPLSDSNLVSNLWTRQWIFWPILFHLRLPIM